MKYQAGVNIAVVEALQGVQKYRVIYREEVPQGEYTLTNSVKRIIALNEIFKPSYLFVDRGYGEHAVEHLKLYGKEHPNSGLHEKTKGIFFSEKVEIIDPITGEKVRKQFKAVMLNYMFKLFEERLIEFPARDSKFEKQLRNYKVIGIGTNTIKTSRKDEHIIDAVGLAVYGLLSNFGNPLKSKSPVQPIVSLPTPKFVPSSVSKAVENSVFTKDRVFITNNTYKEFGRGRTIDINRRKI